MSSTNHHNAEKTYPPSRFNLLANHRSFHHLVLALMWLFTTSTALFGTTSALSPCSAQNSSDNCEHAYVTTGYECGWRMVSLTCMDCGSVQNETSCGTMQQSACYWNMATNLCSSFGYPCASYTTEQGCGTFKGQRSGNRCVWNAAASTCGRCVQFSSTLCPWPLCGVIPAASNGGTAGCNTPKNRCESGLGTQAACQSYEGTATFNCFWDSSNNACTWCGLYPNGATCDANPQCFWSANNTLCISAVYNPNTTSTTTVSTTTITTTTTTTTTDTSTTTDPTTTAFITTTTAPVTSSAAPVATTTTPLPSFVRPIATPSAVPTPISTNATAATSDNLQQQHSKEGSWAVIGGVIGGAIGLIGALIAGYCCLHRCKPSNRSGRRTVRDAAGNILPSQVGDEDDFDQFEEEEDVDADDSKRKRIAIGIRRKKNGDNSSIPFTPVGARHHSTSNPTPNNTSTEDGASNSDTGPPFTQHHGQPNRRTTPTLTTSEEGRSSATTETSDATMMDRQSIATQLQTTPGSTRRPPLAPIMMSPQATGKSAVSLSPTNIPALYLAGHIPRIRIVGRGGSGTVYQCRLPSGEFIAQKEIYAPQAGLITGGALSFSSGAETQTSDTAEGKITTGNHEQRFEALQHSPIGALLREVRVVESINHPNIVKHFGFVLEPDQQRLVLFSEYLPLGNLATMVQSSQTPIHESLARVFTAQITAALAYLHGKGVVHRDIKCDNVLLAGEHRVKLSDFGASKIVGGGAGLTSRGAQTMIGTPCFMAPEVLLGGQSSTSMSSSMENIIVNYDEGYGRRADVWSLGIAILEMLECGKMPWPASAMSSPGAILIHISDPASLPVVPKRLSDAGKDFIRLCCIRDPLQRATCDELLQHPWLCLQNPLTTTA